MFEENFRRAVKLAGGDYLVFSPSQYACCLWLVRSFRRLADHRKEEGEDLMDVHILG
jgi:hypothetical protein